MVKKREFEDNDDGRTEYDSDGRGEKKNKVPEYF